MEWLDHTREGFYLNEHPLGELVIVRNLSNAYDCEGADELSEELAGGSDAFPGGLTFAELELALADKPPR